MKLEYKLLRVEIIFSEIFGKNKILPKNISICIHVFINETDFFNEMIMQLVSKIDSGLFL